MATEAADATSGTTEALQAALEAANREREALAARLDTLDRLVTDLTEAVAAAGEPTTRRGTGRTRARRKTAGKRAGKKAAGKRAGRKAAGKRGATKRTVAKAAARPAQGRRRAGAGRTDRVVEIVRAAGGPLTTGQVRARLAQHEPEVSSKLVSAALTYAGRTGRIRRAAEGGWTSA